MKGIPREDQAFYAQQEESDALFDLAEAAAAAAKAEPDIHRRRERLSEAARLHRLAWEVKARGEYDVE